jgi:hypothetical protein
MEFSEVKRRLSLPSAWDVVGKNWNDGDPSAAGTLLSKERVLDASRAIGITDDLASRLAESGTRLAGDEAASRLFSHCCHLMYDDPEFTRKELTSWPMPPEDFGNLDTFFYAQLVLAGVPSALESYRSRGIDESTAAAAFADLQRWIRLYRRNYGREGFREIKWLIHHVKGRIVELGRLQFLVDTFPSEYYGLRRQDGAVVVLAPSGLDVDDRGVPVLPGVSSPSFTTALTGIEGPDSRRDTIESVTGNPVHPDGFIEERTVTLGPEWMPILWPGKAGISYHIPTAGPMDHAECGRSFQRAAEFFPAHYPEAQSDLFFTSTWLHDAQLAEYLRGESNIVRFQREFYRYPLPGSKGEAIIRFVHGPRPHPVDPDTLPTETTLERAIVSHLKGGRHWHEAGGLIVAQDLAWGTARYRSEWPVFSGVR